MMPRVLGLIVGSHEPREAFRCRARAPAHTQDSENRDSALSDLTLTCSELDALCQATIAELQSDIEAYDERAALQIVDHGRTTDALALQALTQPDTPWGAHNVAKMWLFRSPTARIWGRTGE